MADNLIGLRIAILGAAEARRNLQTAQGDVNKFADALKRITGISSELGGTLIKVGDTITNFGRTLTFGVTAPLLAAGGTLLNFGIQFEDAFAGIAKTIENVAVVAQDGSVSLTAFGQQLRDDIRALALEVPIAATELAKIGEIAGQLGVRGRENLLAFIETIGKLGVSTNLSTEQAAFGFARLENIMGAVGREAETMKDFIERAAATIVALGNNAATTETEVLNMSLRLAAAGRQAGLTTPEILGIAAGLSEIGIRAELGGTAFSRVIQEMIFAIADGGEALQGFAQIAGLSTEEFSAKFKEDALGTIDLFIAKLAEAQDKGLPGLKDILDDLGLSGVRVRDVLGRLGGDLSLLTDNVALATKAWEEQNALNEEAAKRFATVKSQLALLRNRLVDFGITIFDQVRGPLLSLIEKVGSIIDHFKEMDEATLRVGLSVAGFIAAIGPIAIVGGFVVSTLGALISGLGLFIIPLGLAAAGALLLGKRLSELSKAGGVFGFLQDLAGEVDRFIKGVERGVDPLRLFKQSIRNLFPKEVADDINRIVDKIGSLFSTVETSNLANLFSDEVQKVIAQVAKAFESIKDSVSNLPGLIDKGIGKIEEVFQTIDDLSSGKVSLSSLFPPEFSANIDRMLGAFDRINKAVAGLRLPELFQTEVLDTISTLFEKLSGIAETSKLPEFMQSFTAAVVDLRADFLEQFAKTFSGFIEEQGPKIEELFGKIKTAIENVGPVAQSLIDLSNAVVDLAVAMGLVDPDKVKTFESLGDVMGTLAGISLGLLIGGLNLLADAFLKAQERQIVVNKTITEFINRITAAQESVNALVDTFAGGGSRLEQIAIEIRNAIILEITKLKTAGHITFGGFIEDIIALALKLSNILVGNSIFPDMVTDILQTFTDLGVSGLAEFGKFTQGIGDKALEVAGKIKEALSGLFGGGQAEGGEGISFNFDVAAIEAAKTAFNGMQTAIQNVNTELALFQTHVEGILLVQNAFMLLTSAILLSAFSFTTLSIAAVTGFALILFTAITTFTTLQALWITGLSVLSAVWQATFTLAGQQFLTFSETVRTHLALVMVTFNQLIATVLTGIKMWITQYTFLTSTMKKLSLDIIDAVWNTIAFIDAMTGAFKVLTAQAQATARAVCKAAQDMAECMEDAYGGMTGSPELKLQHPFERFEEFLKTSSIPLQLDSLLSPALDLAGQVPVSPIMGGATTIDESINFGNFTGIDPSDRESLAKYMKDSAKRAKTARRGGR